jgi:transcription initiation factor TFIID TATA-box-binding protein
LTLELTDAGFEIEYEPEIFPAVILKLEMPSVTFLLFSTGKFLIQGLRSFEDIEPAIERMRSVI